MNEVLSLEYDDWQPGLLPILLVLEKQNWTLASPLNIVRRQYYIDLLLLSIFNGG